MSLPESSNDRSTGVPEHRRQHAAPQAGSRLVQELLSVDFQPVIRNGTIVWQEGEITWASHPSRTLKGAPLIYGAIREEAGRRRLFEWDTYTLGAGSRGKFGSSVLRLIELNPKGKKPEIRSGSQVFERLDLSNMSQMEQLTADLEEARWSDDPEALDIPDLSSRISDAFALDTPREHGAHGPRTTRSVRDRSQV